MKVLEERKNARDEAEHGEANNARRGGGGNHGFGGNQAEIRCESCWHGNLGVLLMWEDWALREQVQHLSHGILQLLQGPKSRSRCLQEEE